jgi:cytochrome c553
VADPTGETSDPAAQREQELARRLEDVVAVERRANEARAVCRAVCEDCINGMQENYAQQRDERSRVWAGPARHGPISRTPVRVGPQ